MKYNKRNKRPFQGPYRCHLGLTGMAGSDKRVAVALVVGISRYASSRVDSLRFAARDARAMAAALRDPDIANFPADKVALLTDRKATRDAVVRRLSRWLPDAARGAEIVLIYLAGHGKVHLVGSREEGYFLPTDADPEDVITHGIAMSDVSRWIDAIDARAIVVCLDCCHAGKLLTRHGGPGESIARAIGLRPSVLPGLSGEGRFLIASCQENQFSIESPELRHGLFTHYLLEGLKGAGDENKDSRVGVAELFEYVAREVSRAAREKYGLPQTPWANAVNAGGVYLSAPKKTAPAVSPSDLEQLWEDDKAAALVQFEQTVATAEPAAILPILRLLRSHPDPMAVPLLFHCLALPADDIRKRARRALDVLGWPPIAKTVEELARAADPEVMGRVLEGLAGHEASAEVVALLDRLTLLLKDGLRERAIHLLGRKQLGLELEKTRALFQQFHSPYRLVRVLGQGLFTAAYLAQHDLTGMDVVVRVLLPHFAGQPVLRGAFLDLSKRSFKMVHQNLVHTLDVQAYTEQNVYFSIRDYVDGVTLQKLLSSGKRFEPLQVLTILKQIAEALSPWHRNDLPHGGIKPSNIFICEGNRVVLGDPSLPLREMAIYHERLAYDYRYAAPEMFRGNFTPGPAADYYSLGCVAFELFCGRPPFVSDNHFELVAAHTREAAPHCSANDSSVGALADEFVLNLLTKEPERRYSYVDEVLVALAALRHSIVNPPSVSPTASPSYRPPSSNPPDQPTGGGVSLIDEASLDRYASMYSVDPRATVTKGGHTVAPAPPSEISPDRLEIPGYKIIGLIGRGGMGVVYKAEHTRLKRIVALKMILAGQYARREDLARFQIEAEAAARLQHPNIVQVYDVAEYNGMPYLALEYVEGGSLSQQLRDQLQPPHLAAGVMRSLAHAVQAAHERGIIHRDLKPANILLTNEGTPKITDFGLAKQLDRDSEQTRSGMIMGTPSYMAPEQAQGRHVTPLTDIYALGGIMYEMLTGVPPFRGATVWETLEQIRTSEPVPPRRLLPAIPPDLESICLKCLEKDPPRRYPSAAALAEDLQRFLDASPIKARPISSLQRVVIYSRRHSTVTGLALLSVGLAALAVYLMLR